MAQHEVFSFNDLESLEEKAEKLGLDLKFSRDLTPLARPVKVGGKTAPNSIAALPMEGCDSGRDGSPSELVRRRYLRFAQGGFGLIWWEACAVIEEGRANELQMWLTDENLPQFTQLLADAKAAARNTNGYEPVNILQLTHSGRYSRPVGHAARPIIPQHDPLLDPRVGLSPDSPVVTDEYLESLVPMYVHSAVLAQKAGFDGVDVKACHRYLFSELLASCTREGKYGGSLENRIRLMLQIVAGIKAACGGDFIIASRFNAFDAHPYPYGFGCDREDMWKFDPAEPAALVRALCDAGVGLLANTTGNPYYVHPQVTRPFDRADDGSPPPPEHPLESVARMFMITREMQKAAGDIPLIGSGYTWLRSFIPHAGAANLAAGACGFMGLGRCAFAYPDAPRDILQKGALDPKKCCITCGKCTQIMRDHGRTGCVICDSEIYLPLYKQYRAEAIERVGGK